MARDMETGTLDTGNWAPVREELIVADVMQREAPALLPAAHGKPIPPEKQVARLARWTFNMADASDAFTSVYLDELQAEFPRIDDRRAGLANQHSWFADATEVDRGPVAIVELASRVPFCLHGNWVPAAA